MNQRAKWSWETRLAPKYIGRFTMNLAGSELETKYEVVLSILKDLMEHYDSIHTPIIGAKKKMLHTLMGLVEDVEDMQTELEKEENFIFKNKPNLKTLQFIEDALSKNIEELTTRLN